MEPIISPILVSCSTNLIGASQSCSNILIDCGMDDVMDDAMPLRCNVFLMLFTVNSLVE